jgi:putative component of toxin-antitoxin plasmid stabilization module
MNALIEHAEFSSWLRGLRDFMGKARILARLKSAE